MKYFWLLVPVPFFLPEKQHSYHSHCLPLYFSEGHSGKRFPMQFSLIWIHLQPYCFSWWNPRLYFYIMDTNAYFFTFVHHKRNILLSFSIEHTWQYWNLQPGNVLKLDPNASQRTWVKDLLVETIFPLVLFENRFNTPLMPSFFFTKTTSFSSHYTNVPVKPFVFQVRVHRRTLVYLPGWKKAYHKRRK